MTVNTVSNTLLIPVSHYSGCGNDFLLLDNREGHIPELTPECISRLCQTDAGAGVDGLIIAQHSKSADVAMKFYNCDGTEADMCGNGVRCLMQYLRQKRSYPRERCLLETKLRDLILTSDETDVSVQMGTVHNYGWNIPLEHEGKTYYAHHLNTGVPHIVIFTDNLEAVDVARVGRAFRYHEQFAPQGTNVNFVEVHNTTAHIRTYERGVEGETLACGTGVTAAACCLHALHNFASPVSIRVRSGEWLQVLFEDVDGKLDNVTLKGPATWIRDGQITLNTQSMNFTLRFS